VKRKKKRELKKILVRKKLKPKSLKSLKMKMILIFRNFLSLLKREFLKKRMMLRKLLMHFLL